MEEEEGDDHLVLACSIVLANRKPFSLLCPHSLLMLSCPLHILLCLNIICYLSKTRNWNWHA